MRFPLITLMSPSLNGGIARNIVNLANAFHTMGYRVHVLLNDASGPFVPLLDPEVGIHVLARKHPVSGVPALARYLLRHRPAVILAPVPRQAILAWRASRVVLSKTRVYVNVHNPYGRSFGLLSPSKRDKRVQKIRRLYPLCDGVIAVSSGVADDICQLTGLPRDSISVINNPVVTGDVDALSAAPIDHPWFAAGAPPVILSVSRLEANKNLALTMDAFERVRQQVNCRLVYVGDGTERAALEQRAARSTYAADIAFLGHQANPFPYLARAAVLVSASSWEGFGNVLVEALATGTPVVATDCPTGPRDILGDGRYGHLVPMNDAQALADATLQTLRNPMPATLLKAAARRYDAQTIARAYLVRFGLLSAHAEPSGAGEHVSAPKLETTFCAVPASIVGGSPPQHRGHHADEIAPVTLEPAYDVITAAKR